MFLMELGVQVSAEVINRLTPEEHRQIAHAIADLELTDPNSNETSFDFQSMKAKGEAVANLESDYALHLVREALRAESPSQTADAGWPEENLAYFTSSAASEVG
jgi:flagellar motor switch protein FliG